MCDRRWLRGFALGLMFALAWPAATVAQTETSAALRVGAEAGDHGAQNDLGLQLMRTRDEARQAEARTWFRMASEGGNPDGMYNYARMLLMGLGGPSDEAVGRRLRDAAAARGSVAANLALAELYTEGSEGYPTDPARVLAHVRAAAESGSRFAPYAQWRLGMMHLQGIGTPADPAEAWPWVVRASESGEVNAMISRAVMLATGEGVTEDDVAARDWYRRASETDDPLFAHALRGLGGMLIEGEGGPADVARGIAYLRIASAANDENAALLLSVTAQPVTPQVDAAAREIADRWIAQHRPALAD